MSFRSARFLRGDPPISQQSHTQVTRREGELRDRSEQSEYRAQSAGRRWCPHMQSGSVSGQVAAVVACVWWSGRPTELSVACGTALANLVPISRLREAEGRFSPRL